MFEEAKLASLYAETPVHPGAGTVINNPVDNPIQRERHTQYPVIPGSSLKGVLRTQGKYAGIEKNEQIFGKPDSAGFLSCTDGRVLAFPVRTMKGVFGWITAPTVLDRFQRDLKLLGKTVQWRIPEVEKDQIYLDPNSNIQVNDKCIIEDIQLRAANSNYKELREQITNLLPPSKEYSALQRKLGKDLGIVSDDVFTSLVATTTEVLPGIRIDEDTGTAEEGALWYIEYLPADTLTYFLMLLPSEMSEEYLAPASIIKELEKLNGKAIQVGGNATTGKGLMRLHLLESD